MAHPERLKQEKQRVLPVSDVRDELLREKANAEGGCSDAAESREAAINRNDDTRYERCRRADQP